MCIGCIIAGVMATIATGGGAIAAWFKRMRRAAAMAAVERE